METWKFGYNGVLNLVEKPLQLCLSRRDRRAMTINPIDASSGRSRQMLSWLSRVLPSKFELPYALHQSIRSTTRSLRSLSTRISASHWTTSRKLIRIRSVFVGVPVVRGKDGYPYSFFSLTDSTPPIRPSLIEDMADLLVYHGSFRKADLIVSEADRGGGPLTQAVAVRTGLPYTLANWYPEEIQGQIAAKASVGFSGTGFIYLNGITPGQKVILVDDLLSSGGTALALIEAVEQAGAQVIEALFVGEKWDIGGRERIAQKYNIPIKTLVQFTANGGDKTKLVCESD